MGKKILNIALIALLVSMLLGTTNTNKEIKENNQNPIIVKTIKNDFKLNKPLEFDIINQSLNTLSFKIECPNLLLKTYKIENGKEILKTAKSNLNCEQEQTKNLFEFKVPPLSKIQYSYQNWTNQLFDSTGTYVLKQDFLLEDGTTTEVVSNQFNYNPKGFFTRIWNDLIYQPIFNILILILSLSPNLNLGIAIIVLTIILRLLLHTQNKKAMIAQRKLAKVQPKLNEIREKYKNYQAQMAQETMKIWSQEKINPFSSITPMLIQFPILISLFYVIQAVLNIDNQYLIYDVLSHVRLEDISSSFFGLLDLRNSNKIVLPVIVALLQFIQMYMTLPKKEVNEKKDTQQSIQNGMLYFMPALIAVITATLPAGVGLYWGTSTLFGIVQQHFINKSN